MPPSPSPPDTNTPRPGTAAGSTRREGRCCRCWCAGNPDLPGSGPELSGAGAHGLPCWSGAWFFRRHRTSILPSLLLRGCAGCDARRFGRSCGSPRNIGELLAGPPGDESFLFPAIHGDWLDSKQVSDGRRIATQALDGVIHRNSAGLRKANNFHNRFNG